MIWIALFSIVYARHFAGAEPPRVHALEEFQSAVEEVVEDDERRERAVDLLEQSRERFKEGLETLEGLREEFWAVDARYDATEADYRKAWSRIQKAWEGQRKEALDLHYQVRRELTKEEWSYVHSEVEPAIDEVLAALESALESED